MFAWLLSMVIIGALFLIGWPPPAPESALILEYEIPDLENPYPEEQRNGTIGEAPPIPFLPTPLKASDVVGRSVDEIGTNLGTYGMGGPVFFGLRLGDEWLTVAIWGAGSWILVDGLLVQDPFQEGTRRPLPWIHNGADRLTPELVGATITSLDLQARSLTIGFSNGMTLSILETHKSRPINRGNGSKKKFVEGDDLRDVVFLSPTPVIWI